MSECLQNTQYVLKGDNNANNKNLCIAANERFIK